MHMHLVNLERGRTSGNFRRRVLAVTVTEAALTDRHSEWTTALRVMPSSDIHRPARAQAHDALARALAALPPAQRAVLVLRHLDGYDDPAIARILGCSEVTVRSHASRGLAGLRALLHAEDVSHD